MGREPAWDCRLPRRGRLTRSLATISLGRLPAGRAGRQGEGGDGTGAHMGMRAPKEREAHSVRVVRISFGTALRPGRAAGPRRGRLTRSLAILWDASRLGKPGGEEREAKRMSWELLACSFRRCKQYTLANLSSIQSRVLLHLSKLFMLSSQSYFIGRNIAQKRRQPVLPDCLFGLHAIVLCFAEPTRHYCT